MRRSISVVLVLIVVPLLVVSPGRASSRNDAAVVIGRAAMGVITSPNIDYVMYVPLDVPAVSGALREVNGRRLFYVWGMKGLAIYDVEQPELPLRLGYAPLPASQGEDLQVSADGKRAIVVADGGSSTPIPVNTGLHVLDTSDPANPRVVASLSSGLNHAAHCADDACEFVYGNRGSIYHVPRTLTGPDDIRVVGNWLTVAGQGGGPSSAHALHRTTHADGRQIMITDSTPRVILDVTNPESPVVLARSRRGDHTAIDGALQHNNVRPDAERWEPRDPLDPGPTYRAANGLQQIPGQLRPGELLIAGSETNQTVQCPAAPGKLTTWSLANFDRGAEPRPLATLSPRSSLTFENGDPPANVQGCSSHWFDVIEDPAETAPDGQYLLSAGWYEHGVRVIAVDPVEYGLKIVGYAQLAMGSAASAYWIPEARGGTQGVRYIYAPDYRRGLHVLRYRPDVPSPSR